MALVQNFPSDFVLFPRDRSYFDMSDSRQDGGFEGYQYDMTPGFQQDFVDLAHSTYDSYSTQPAFSSVEQSYYTPTPQFVVNHPKDNLPRFEQSASPSISVSQSLEHVSSNLSHTSGASGQSSASSAVGSPFSQATHSIPGQEHWIEHQGLGLSSGSITEDFSIDQFTLSVSDAEQLSFANDKFPGSCVGESRNVSSSFISGSPVMHSPISCSSLTATSVAPSFPSPALALDTASGPRPMTIDTILEEVHGTYGTPMHMASPVAMASPSDVSSPAHQQEYAPQAARKKTNDFKSPTTPASAMSPCAPFTSSPFAMRTSRSRQGSTNTGKHCKGQTRSSPTSGTIPYSATSNNAYGSQFQTPFFAQSSGRYVAPLQSTCWFSLAVYFLFHFMKIPVLEYFFIFQLYYFMKLIR